MKWPWVRSQLDVTQAKQYYTEQNLDLFLFSFLNIFLAQYIGIVDGELE